jgi:hypothetical protein
MTTSIFCISATNHKTMHKRDIGLQTETQETAVLPHSTVLRIVPRIEFRFTYVTSLRVEVKQMHVLCKPMTY